MKQNLLFNQLTAMPKRLAMVLTLLFTLGVGSMLGAEELVYTLTPVKGSNSDYTKNCDINISDITWNLAGNSQMIPWRIGGKSLTKVDRALYSKTAISNDVSKIVITHGTASNITVNSMKVIVSTNSNGGGTVLSTLTPTFKAGEDVTVTRPSGVSWENAYYKIVYNVTVSGSSNKFIEFEEAKFYEETAPAVTHTVTWVVNGGTYTTGSPSTSVSGGSKVTQLPTDPDDCSADVVFVGWTESTTFNGTKPSDLFSDVEGSPVIDKRTTFYAVFAKREGEQKETTNTATISGSTDGSVKDVLSWRSEQQNSANAPTWNTNSSEYRFYYHSGGNGCSMTIEAEDGVTITGITITATGTSYTPTVKYNVDGGSDQTGSWSSTTMTITELSAESFKFRNANTTNTQLRFKNVVVTYSMLSGEYTYTDYTTSCTTETTITLNPNGGVIENIDWDEIDGKYTQSFTASEQITLPTPTKAGNRFDGWYDENDNKVESSYTVPATDITLTAKWTAYTVNWTITPAEGGTLSATTGNTTSVSLDSEYEYESSAYTVTSGAAGVTQNNNTFTAVPTSNCTIQINLKLKPRYTVTLKDEDTELHQASFGASVELPSRESCKGYTFEGWTKTWSEQQDEWTDIAPDIIPAGDYTPTGDEELYPVYSKVEDGGTKFSRYEKVISNLDDWSGKYLISNGTSTATGQKFSGTALAIINFAPGITENKDYEFTIVKNGNNENYYIISPDNTFYVGGAASGVSLVFNESATEENYLWKLQGTDPMTTNVATNRYIGVGSESSTTVFKQYSTGGSNAKCYLYKRIEEASSTTYYISVPSCCSTIAPTNGAYNTDSDTEVILTWEDANNYGRYHITGGNLAAEGVYYENKNYPVSGLTKCQSYTFQVTAYPTNGCESPAITIHATPYKVKTVTFIDGSNTTTKSTSCGAESVTIPTASKDCYTSVWKDQDGKEYNSGATITPTKDLTLIAHYNIITYTIQFVDEDGTTILQSSTVNCGTTPSYTGSTPTKDSDEIYDYEFAGWDPTIVAAKSDATYTATYNKTKRTYTVQWYVNGVQYGTDQTVTAGETATAPAIAEVPCGAVIAGWTDAEGGNYVHASTLHLGATPSIEIRSNKIFYAVFADYAD